MKKAYILFIALFCALCPVVAQQPLYFVNGVQRQDIGDIPPDDIERVEMLPADEQTIARYGEGAAHGVMLVTLRYDEPARFFAGENFDDYIARQVRWDENEPVARVVLRYKITPEGHTEIVREIESTDNRLRRRVVKAVAQAPLWTPARKDGKPIESDGVLHIQLPAGKPMPRPMELVYR